MATLCLSPFSQPEHINQSVYCRAEVVKLLETEPGIKCEDKSCSTVATVADKVVRASNRNRVAEGLNANLFLNFVCVM